MASVTLLDESARPRAPRIAGVTPRQRAHGRHLALIHAMHLADMDEIAQLMDAIEAVDGAAAPTDRLAAVAEAVRAMEPLRRLRLFGSLCGQECRVITAHHDIEEGRIFPALAACGSDGLRAVLDKLAAEHRVIHAALEETEALASAVLADPGPSSHAALAAAFRDLHALLRSHFAYEEGELEEAIGAHGIPI